MKNKLFRKIVSVIATSSLLFNSIAPYSLATAQEITPEPTPVPSVEPTVAPSEEPTTTPESTPAEVASPTPEVIIEATPTVEATTPAPESQPEVQSQSNENAQSQGPPTETITPTPTITPIQPEKEGSLTAEVLETDLFSETLQENPWFKVITDKLDYAPTEVAVITGTGFTSGETYSLTVSSTDEPATSVTVEVVADSNGSFTYVYQLDGIYRPNYLVEVKEGETVIASITFTDSPACQNDIAVNDQPGQKDLTRMCINNDNEPTSTGVNWNWDEIYGGGNNTYDGCSLWDSDGDGKANYSLCVSVLANPSTDVMEYSGMALYSCGDDRSDRCSQTVTALTQSAGTSCSTSQQSNDPFTTGAATPQDTGASCTITPSDIGGVSSVLLDVCSYPSQQPNSDPSDCIVASTANDTGSIEVIKDLYPSSDTGRFNLQIDGESIVTNVGDGGTTGALDYSTGDHTIGEIAYTGTDLASYTSSISCANSQGSVSSAGPLTINLSKNENIVCTITNTLRNGTLTVQKTTIPAADSTSFTINATGSGTITGGSAGTVSDSADQVYTVTAGTYSVSETVPSGWSKTGDTCQNVVVGAGQNATCLITNTKLGKIVVVKQTLPDGSNQSFSFTPSYGGGFSLTDGQINDSGFTLTPNTYSVSETIPSEWDQTSATCSDGSLVSAINLSAGETVTCTFTNTQRGHIVVDKVTDPSGDLQSFTFTPSYGASFGLTDAGTPNDSGALTPGTYTVTETVPAGWDLTSATCTDGSDPTNINLGAGETVTCTFNNQKDAKIIVAKVTNPTGIQTSFEFDPSWNSNFFLSDGQSNDSGDLTPGTYSVSEIVPLVGWDLTSANCSDQSPVDSISLQAGETITCTFTNTQRGNISGYKYEDQDGDGINDPDWSPVNSWVIELWQGQTKVGETQTDVNGYYSFTNLLQGAYQLIEQVLGGWTNVSPTTVNVALTPGESDTGNNFINTRYGTIVVEKQTIPNGSAQIFDFNLSFGDGDADLSDGQQDSTGNLLPGSYSVSETALAGWDLTSTVCTSSIRDTESAGSLELDSGETITCVFTNTRDTGTITVQKQLDPTNDPGLFNLLVDDVVQASDVGNGGSTEVLTVDTGNHIVSETAGTSTSLSDYNSSIDCGRSGSGQGTTLEEITVNKDQGIVCVISNSVKRGSITITKYTDPEGSQELFTFNLGGTATNSADLIDGQSKSFDDLIPGSYTLGEQVPDGWDLTDISCDNDISLQNGASIDLSAGENVNCSFTNTQRGHIIIEKVTNPEGDQTSFDVNAATDDGEVLGDTTGGTISSENPDNFEVKPGTYDISETVPDGWEQTDATCNNEDSPSELVISAGQTVTCTFTNTKLGKIIVKKSTNRESEASFEFSSNFNDGNFFLSDGGEFDSEFLTPGTYNVSELKSEDWDLESATCDDESPTGAISLQAGETVTCTFNNVKLDPEISIIKLNNSGGGISAGSTVTYTLTITNNGNVDFNNLLVTDFLPGGFTYINGSTTGATFINAVGSKLTWNVDSLGEGETATITYQVLTNSNLTDGDYKNFATCQATYNEESQISCDQVNSTVKIGHGVSYGGNLLGQVLGASTELPATGSPTLLLIVSLGLLGTGLFLGEYNRKRNHVKN